MRHWYIYIILIVLPLRTAAQDISFKANYPGVVTDGEQFAVSWTVNSGAGDFSEPPFTGFHKLAGPQTSYSSSTQIINGKFSQQTTYTYTYYLQAMNVGKFVISPATIKIKNKEYKSDSLHIEVVKNQVLPQQQQPQGNRTNENQAGTADQTPGTDLFIRLILNRTRVYQGEYIVASVKIYSRVDLSGFNEIKYPDFKGFLKEDLETPQLTSLQRENVNGVIYGTGIIQQFLLFPQITGDITIDPVEVTAMIRQKVGDTDPFFGDFFSSYRNVPEDISSKPIKIKVDPLPEPRPADFSGLVGNINLAASLNKDSVNVNDALNYKITVSGAGNLKIAGTPSLTLSPDIEIYEPKITDNIKNSATGSTGQKIFEFVLIPRHYGEYTVPSVSYTYFDPASKQYHRLTTREFRFYARKIDDQGGAVTVYGGVSKEDVKYVGKDIRFIRSVPGLLKSFSNVLILKKSFLSCYAIALAVFIIILVLRREHIRRNADISAVRNRKAGKVAGKRLRKASDCLKSGAIDQFHEEILKALWGYLSDKLNIPVSELTRSRAVEALHLKGIPEEQTDKLGDLLDKCEYARFAPSGSDAEASQIYSGAMRFIKAVENTI
jgi:hypothetical protein